MIADYCASLHEEEVEPGRHRPAADNQKQPSDPLNVL